MPKVTRGAKSLKSAVSLSVGVQISSQLLDAARQCFDVRKRRRKQLRSLLVRPVVIIVRLTLCGVFRSECNYSLSSYQRKAIILRFMIDHN